VGRRHLASTRPTICLKRRRVTRGGAFALKSLLTA
jgi:hypothetical protein